MVRDIPTWGTLRMVLWSAQTYYRELLQANVIKLRAKPLLIQLNLQQLRCLFSLSAFLFPRYSYAQLEISLTDANQSGCL